jgi:hypothetical protein
LTYIPPSSGGNVQSVKSNSLQCSKNGQNVLRKFEGMKLRKIFLLKEGMCENLVIYEEYNLIYDFALNPYQISCFLNSAHFYFG